MSLKLIYGPPNSGRAGLIRQRFENALDLDPILVLPTVDDVYAFESELCGAGASLGGAVTTFAGLFRAVAGGDGEPPAAELTPAQRSRAISVAIAERRDRLGPLRRSASRPGFALAFERLLDELQAAGLQPAAVEAGAGTLEGSAYLNDLATLFDAYAEVCARLGRTDSHGVAVRAVELLRDGDIRWRRPVFLYGFDDLTPSQLALIAALAEAGEVTVALTYEEGSAALAARAAFLERLRQIGVEDEVPTVADPGNTADPLLFHLERRLGAAEPERRPPGEGLAVLRSAGVRGEAEAIGVEVAKLIAAGADPGEIAIALRDPERRGPLVASVLESYDVAVALEADLPVTATAVGGTLLALLAAMGERGTAADLLRFMRGLSGLPDGKVDWFERALRRRRVREAAAALELWRERHGEPPRDLALVDEAIRRGPVQLAATVARLASTMASRPLRENRDGPPPGRGDGLELRAAAAISTALNDLTDPAQLAPRPQELLSTIGETRFRAWSGPVAGRVRIANPYALRAARFDYVFVGSLQDGEFPRRDRGGDPFLSDGQRQSLGLPPRRDAEAEERYLFHACIALPRRRLFLSYRDSDENGAAEPRSPLLDDVGRLMAFPHGDGTDPLEASVLRSRDLAQVVHPVAEAPSERELARAIAAQGPAAGAGALLTAAAVDQAVAGRIEARIEKARAAEAASRAPGPLTDPAVIEALAAVPAYGGTTLEGFDLCSYRWFVAHELSPKPLDPAPDPLVQGGLMHEALERLYGERPGGDPLPRPGSLPAWTARGRELVAETAAGRGLGGHPAERAIVRRVEGLLARFLEEEARREDGFEPWLLEAGFGEEDDMDRPALRVDGWRLHGAIDRVDRDASGRALVLDYKLAGAVTPRGKLEEEAKLQLQLYLIAVAEQWGAEPAGGLYLPLRGTSARRPRGFVRDDASAGLASLGLARTDVVDHGEFEELLGEARRRAGEIVARMRSGDIRRDPGPRSGLRGHGVCPPFCDFAPICRRDRAPVEPDEEEGESR